MKKNYHQQKLWVWWWLAENNVLSYNPVKVDNQLSCAKRIFLKRLVFDPLGFLSPLCYSSKILIPTLWEAGLDWNTVLNPDLIGKVNKWLDQVQELKNAAIHRCICLPQVSIDDIIIDYMVSVLESLGGDPSEVETSFDVEEFTEMMAAYIPGFESISSTIVTEWMFALSKLLESGGTLLLPKVLKPDCSAPKNNVDEGGEAEIESWDNLPMIRSNPAGECQAIRTNCKNLTGNENTEKPLIPDLMSVQFSLRNTSDENQIPGLMSVELPGIYSFPKLFDEEDENSPAMDALQDQVANVSLNFPYTSLRVSPDVEHKEENPLETKDNNEAAPVRLSNKEKITLLLEMFADVPEVQLRRCLSRAKGNMEKAVKLILAGRNDPLKQSNNYKEEQLEDEPNCSLDPIFEKNVIRLKDIFPRVSESRIRDRLQIVGGDVERATQVLLSEEDQRLIAINNKTKFQVHKTSSKKISLTREQKAKIKEETIAKYGLVEDVPGKVHKPVVLIKEDSNAKVTPITSDKTNTRQDDGSSLIDKTTLSNTPEDKKPRINPKLVKKTRYK